MTTEQIKQAIKAQKWDKASYAYAIDSMNPWTFTSGMYLKKELIERFYSDIQSPKKWACISHFTTFQTIK